MTTERQRRIAQQRLFHEGDYPALIASMAGRLMALEAHAVKHGYELPQEADPLSAVLERAERARENIEAREKPKTKEQALPSPNEEDADFVRSFLHDGETFGDAEPRLIAKTAALRNKLLSGMIDGPDRDHLKRLERLFTVEGPERVVYVDVPVEVPVDNAETVAKLERAEADLRRAEGVLAKAQQVPAEEIGSSDYSFSKTFLLGQQRADETLLDTNNRLWLDFLNIDARLQSASSEDLERHAELHSSLLKKT